MLFQIMAVSVKMKPEIDLFTVMNERYQKMSRGNKAIVRYITDNSNSAAFMTAARLGKAVGVSESTVVRFAIGLGYDGYPEFQKALEEIVKGRLSSIGRVGTRYGKSTQSEIISSVLGSDMKKISDTLEMLDPAAFESAVDIITKSEHIYVLGLRSCAPLAGFLSFYLNMMLSNVVLLQTTSSSEIFEQMLRINEKDCFIGISFPRYSMRTLKSMEFANQRNAGVISITDCMTSPMTMYSSCNLLCRSDQISIVDSLVAPLSLINALVVAICIKRQESTIRELDTLEQVWSDYQVYGTDEINILNEDVIRNYPELHIGKENED